LKKPSSVKDRTGAMVILGSRGDSPLDNQVRGFAPMGIVEYWNIGKMGPRIIQYKVGPGFCTSRRLSYARRSSLT
jgi:hypothetical protein